MNLLILFFPFISIEFHEKNTNFFQSVIMYHFSQPPPFFETSEQKIRPHLCHQSIFSLNSNGEAISSIPFNMIDVNNQKNPTDFISYPLVWAINETNLITCKKNLYSFLLFYYCLALLILLFFRGIIIVDQDAVFP